MFGLDLSFTSVFREFITLFVVIDPVGSIPVFLFAVQSVPTHLHRRFAMRAILIAAIVLMAFLIGGQVVLETIGLRLGSFQIAGGLVLFLFALTMVFGESKPSQEIAEAEHDLGDGAHDHLSGAVFPLAMPSIASPGAMLAIVILTDNQSSSVPEQVLTGVLLVAVLLITLGLLLAAGMIYRVIGSTGASVISRVMGLILATIAIDSILNGMSDLGLLAIAPV